MERNWYQGRTSGVAGGILDLKNGDGGNPGRSGDEAMGRAVWRAKASALSWETAELPFQPRFSRVSAAFQDRARSPGRFVCVQ